MQRLVARSVLVALLATVGLMYARAQSRDQLAHLGAQEQIRRYAIWRHTGAVAGAPSRLAALPAEAALDHTRAARLVHFHCGVGAGREADGKLK